MISNVLKNNRANNMSPQATSEAESSDIATLTEIDPVTGQVNTNEHDLRAEWNALSEEEKEKEAQHLEDLIDRLNRNGIIRIQQSSN